MILKCPYCDKLHAADAATLVSCCGEVGHAVPLTSAQKYDLAASHDWYYEYSDDHRVWQRGSQRQTELYALAVHDPEFRALLDAFSNHYHKGAPAPERRHEH